MLVAMASCSRGYERHGVVVEYVGKEMVKTHIVHIYRVNTPGVPEDVFIGRDRTREVGDTLTWRSKNIHETSLYRSY